MAWTVNQRRFSADILHRLGAPVTPANLAAMAAWQRSEGGSARFNPFNTTQSAPGAGSYNSIGVRNYTSYQQGLNATVKTITNGRYAGIISALRRGSNPYAVAAAVGNSPWGSSGSLMSSVLRGMGGNWPHPPRGGGGGVSPGTNKIQQVIKFAKAQLGEPYVWGGTGPSGWDCSGIVYAAYRHAGYQGIGRTTYDQIKQGHGVPLNRLVAGDIVFAGTGHEGLYIGNGKILSAPHTGANVHIMPLSQFGATSARRLIKGGGGVVPPNGIGGVSPSGLPIPSPAQMRALAQSQYAASMAGAKAMSKQALTQLKPGDLTAPTPVSQTQLQASQLEAPGVQRLAETTDMLGQIKSSAWRKSGLGVLAGGL